MRCSAEVCPGPADRQQQQADVCVLRHESWPTTMQLWHQTASNCCQWAASDLNDERCRHRFSLRIAASACSAACYGYTLCIPATLLSSQLIGTPALAHIRPHIPSHGPISESAPQCRVLSPCIYVDSIPYILYVVSHTPEQPPQSRCPPPSPQAQLYSSPQSPRRPARRPASGSAASGPGSPRSTCSKGPHLAAGPCCGSGRE